MTLPVIITSTREALAAVPMAFREACWSLGASRWQTIRTIVLPNSIAGILTGVILQVARAAGETAPILFTGAVLFVAIPDSGWESLLPYGLEDRFMALFLPSLCVVHSDSRRVGSVDVRHGRRPDWPGTDGQQYFHWIANLLTIAKEVVSGTGVGWSLGGWGRTTQVLKRIQLQGGFRPNRRERQGA